MSLLSLARPMHGCTSDAWTVTTRALRVVDRFVALRTWGIRLVGRSASPGGAPPSHTHTMRVAAPAGDARHAPPTRRAVDHRCRPVDALTYLGSHGGTVVGTQTADTAGPGPRAGQASLSAWEPIRVGAAPHPVRSPARERASAPIQEAGKADWWQRQGGGSPRRLQDTHRRSAASATTRNPGGPWRRIRGRRLAAPRPPPRALEASGAGAGVATRITPAERRAPFVMPACS